MNRPAPTAPLLLGCDFSSAPSARKAIVVAVGQAEADAPVVRLTQLLRFATLQGWQDWLAAQPAWVGGFDFPFGLPRELVQALGWPTDWEACIRHYAVQERPQLRAAFRAFCNARPAGHKFAHRATDGPAGASPSMKWVNPPVAWMLHAGVPRLLEVGARLPGLGGPPGANRVALEAYPGLLARDVLGRRSYKSDALARQTPERAAARALLLRSLRGQGSARLGWRLALGEAQARQLRADASGDAIDAVLCLLQAAWAAARADSAGPGYGLPDTMDPLEGWILGA